MRILVLLMLCSCSHQLKKLDFKPDVYVGDHISVDISRNKGTERINCSDKLFDEYVCLSGMEYKRLYEACR